LDEGARRQGAHLAIADVQQASPSHAPSHPCDGGDVQRVIGALSRHDVCGYRQPQGIQHRQQDFHLRQVWTMVLAMPKLKQPVFRHTPIPTGGGRIQPHALGLQIVHAQQLLGPDTFKRLPVHVIAQRLQHGRQAVVAPVQGVDSLAGRAAQGLEPLHRPGFHLVQPMVRFR
jgi:hypothetical protein